MNNVSENEYVIVENGNLSILANPDKEIISMAKEGISTDNLEMLKTKTSNELMQINSGALTVLKHIKIYKPELESVQEVSYKVNEVAATEVKKKPRYNNLAELIVPTDKRMTLVWE